MSKMLLGMLPTSRENAFLAGIDKDDNVVFAFQNDSRTVWNVEVTDVEYSFLMWREDTNVAVEDTGWYHARFQFQVILQDDPYKVVRLATEMAKRYEDMRNES